MSEDHSHRTATRERLQKLRGLAERRRGFWLGVAALLMVFMAANIWVIAPVEVSAPVKESGRPADVLKDQGYLPLLPPRRLGGVGSLYQVDGNSYGTLCDAEHLASQAAIRYRTVNRALNRSSRFLLSGDYVKELNSKLADARVTAIEYEIHDQSIVRLTDRDLTGIQEALLREPYCNQIVMRELNANKQICSSRSALGGTVSYKVYYDEKLAMSPETKMTAISVVQRAIELQTGGQIHIVSSEELAGDNLLYGIELSKTCLMLSPLANSPSTAPVIHSRPLGDKLRELPVKYNSPGTLFLGSSTPIELVIDTAEYQPASASSGVDRGLPSSPPSQAVDEMFKGFQGEIRSTKVRVADGASAYLTGPKDMLEITLRGVPFRTVTTDTPISWIWDVRPVKPGKAQIVLEVFSHETLGSKETQKQIRVHQDTWIIEAKGLEWIKYQLAHIEPIRAFVFTMVAAVVATLAFFGIKGWRISKPRADDTW